LSEGENESKTGSSRRSLFLVGSLLLGQLERKKLLEEGRAFVRSLCIEEEGAYGGGGGVKWDRTVVMLCLMLLY